MAESGSVSKSHFEADEIGVRRHDVQARHGRRQRRIEQASRARSARRRSSWRAPSSGDAEPGRGVALRIEIDDQHPLADRGERRAEIDGRRRLADAALLIGDRQNPGLAGSDRRCSSRINPPSWRSNARITTIRPSASVRLGCSSPSNIPALAAPLRFPLRASRPLRNNPIVLAGKAGRRQLEKPRQRSQRTRRDHVDCAKLSLSRGFFDSLAQDVHSDPGLAARPRAGRRPCACRFRRGSSVAPPRSASRIASTSPGKPAPEPRSSQRLASGGASARSWAESAKWRCQTSSSVLGATRLIVFCHCLQQGRVSLEPVERFT